MKILFIELNKFKTKMFFDRKPFSKCNLKQLCLGCSFKKVCKCVLSKAHYSFFVSYNEN